MVMELTSLRAAIVTAHVADAELAVQLLAEGGVAAIPYSSIRPLRESLPEDIGCIVLAAETLAEDELTILREMIEHQPAWSDLPLILVAPDSAGLGSLLERTFPNSGNLTLLEQPLNQATLLSAVRVGLRARVRQLEVRDLLAQRDKALRLRDEFLAMLAHELRNPLAPMRNAIYLQQMLHIDDPLFDKTRAILDRQTQHLSRMVDDLLDVARLERGKLQLQRECVDLNALAATAIEGCLPVISGSGHSVKFEPAGETLTLDADPVRLEQLLINLLLNACKFTPQPGVISVRTWRDDATAAVAVSDTGIGLSAAMLQDVFHPFTQGERTLDRSDGGLGIGLTISRRLAELHGGKLWADSAGPGQGATFTASFPLILPAEAETGTSMPTGQPAQRQRVIIVEDNADIRESLRIILETWGHEVNSAATGPSGLEMIRDLQPDVALIDIGLPGMNGYEVARTVRNGGAPRTKLVAITGYGQPADRERTLRAGFDVHLLKPIDPLLLQSILSV